jgi:5-methylcytosine-specific restriction endonuclease McrA
MSDYLDPRWIKIRNEVRKRDNYTCTRCKCRDKVLHVHHTRYVKGRKLWDVPKVYLITLCEDCHEKEHKNKKIGEYYKDPNSKSLTKAERKELTKKKKNKGKDKKKKVLTPFTPNRYNTSWFDW